ncbi:MAG: tetratricopeptide repeat protein [Deltaproteobacteria bacterium]|nr:tetratricopeptide repeat protein [Deltaproteobacteria bacterium]MBN2671939.1 tetratricopeptide repeat protein [Deltaproteobacteria bacterium]
MTRQNLSKYRRTANSIVRWATLCGGMIILIAACGGQPLRQNDESYSRYFGVVNTPYFSETDTPRLIKRLQQRDDAGSRFLLATLYDESGQPENAFAEYMAVIEAARKDSALTLEATAAALAIVTLRDRVKQFEPRFESFVKNVTVAPKQLPLEALYQLRTLQFSFALKSGTQIAADRLLEKTGCLSTWNIAGPFPPGESQRFKQLIEGNLPWPQKIPLGPGRPTTAPEHRRIHVCQVESPQNWSPPFGTIVARTQIVLPERQTVFFRLQGGIQTQVHINGKQVFSQTDDTQWLPDVTWFSASLSRGTHVIAVVATSDQYLPSFSLSAIGKSSRPLPTGKHINSTAALQTSKPAHHILFPIPDSPSSALAAYKIHLWNNNPYDAFSIQSVFSADVPQTALLLADWYADTPLVAPEIGYEKARQIFETIDEKHPQAYRAALFLAKYAFANEQIQQSLRYLKRAVEASPSEPSLRLAQAEIQYANGWYHQALQAVDQAEQILGTTCPILQWKYNIALSQKNPVLARSYAERISQCNSTSQAYATELARHGNYTEAAEQLKRIAEHTPNSPAASLQLADALLRSGEWDQAIHTLATGHNQFPFDQSIYLALLDTLHGADKETEIIALLDSETAILPDILVEKFRYLHQNQPLFTEYRLDGPAVVRAYLQTQKNNEETDFSWILDRMVHIINEQGNRIQLTHWIGRVNTLDMIDRYAEVEVPLGNQLLIARTIKQDGTLLYPSSIKNKSTISMPNLEVGDFIEFESVAAYPPDPIFTGGFDTEPFYFQDFDATFVRSEMILVAPENIPLQYELRGDVPERIETVHNGLRVITYRKRNGTPLHKEPDAPVSTEYLPSVRITSQASTAQVCRFLTRQYRSKSKSDPLLQRFMDTQQYCETCDETQIPQALYYWILENIEDDDILSDHASHIFSRKRGSRIRLYQTLLKLAGISSQIGFVMPTYEDNTPSDIPDLHRIPFPVLQLEDGIFVSMSDDYAPFGYIPTILRSQPVLFPDACEQSQTDTGKWPFDDEHINANINIKEDGTALGRFTHTITGEKAAVLRELFINEPESQKKLFEEILISEQLPGAILQSLHISHLHSPAQPLQFTYEAQMPGVSAEFQTGEFTIPLQTDFTHYTSGLRSRKFPLVLSIHRQMKVETTIRLPQSRNFDSTAYHRCEKMKQGNASYCIRITPNQNTVRISANTTLDIKRTPPEQYESFHEFALITEQMNAESIQFH